MREASIIETLCDLTKPLYVGRETEKIMFIIGLLKAATLSGNSFLRRKAYVEMKELVDRTGLEMMKNAVETLEARYYLEY